MALKKEAEKSEKDTVMQERETLDERLPGLFEPDTLLPVQYFEVMRRKHFLEGEKRLVLSVLEDAVECFMKGLNASTTKGQKLYRDAAEWISLEDKQKVFSFDNVCEMLDIDPDYMRRGLFEWRERKLAGASAEPQASRGDRAEARVEASASRAEGPQSSVADVSSRPVDRKPEGASRTHRRQVRKRLKRARA